MNDPGEDFLADFTIAELHLIATRALAEGDDYTHGLLREQLIISEEFAPQ